MEGTSLLIDALGRIQQTLHSALSGLSPANLVYRPKPDCNPIGWLAWHLTRVQDHHISSLSGSEQAWIVQSWCSQFDMSDDADDIGWGHTIEQVNDFRPPPVRILLDYHDAVVERSKEYLAGLTAQDLECVLNEPHWQPLPTVGIRLVSVVNDNTEHVGQIAYLKGYLHGMIGLE